MIQSDTVTLSQRNIASTAKNRSFPASSHCATRVFKVKSLHKWCTSMASIGTLLLLDLSSIALGVFQK